MTSQGSAHGRFTRAIGQRNLFQAEIAAREFAASRSRTHSNSSSCSPRPGPTVSNRQRSAGTVGVEVELPALTLAEARFALAALERLRADAPAADTLRSFLLWKASRATLRQIQERVWFLGRAGRPCGMGTTAPDTEQHLAMLRILYGACVTALDAFRAADNSVDAQLVMDLEAMVARTHGEIERLSARLAQTS